MRETKVFFNDTENKRTKLHSNKIEDIIIP